MTCHNIEAGVYIVGISDMHLFPLETHAYGPSIVAPFLRTASCLFNLSFENITKASVWSFIVLLRLHLIMTYAWHRYSEVSMTERRMFDKKSIEEFDYITSVGSLFQTI